jgi:acetoin utilization deacetylase AcuC-like enzyme
MDDTVGCYHFGVINLSFHSTHLDLWQQPKHPMKPYRLTLTHNLVLDYGLTHYLNVYQARPASERELREFHADDYIDFLKRCLASIVPMHVQRLITVDA